MNKSDKYFVSFDISRKLIKLGLNPKEDDYSCQYFFFPSTFEFRILYSRVLHFLESKGYVITTEVDYYNIGNYAFRSNLYYNAEKIYTSEWVQSRERALNDSIIKVLEDYL